MSKEIKMSDMFAIPVRRHYSVLVDRNENQCSYSTQIEYATHAINDHDRLVEENKRLREFLASLQLDVSDEIKLEQLLSELDGE